MALVTWGRVVLVDPSGAESVVWLVGERPAPDVGLVDALARWKVAAARTGVALRVEAMCPELRELLDLVGLLGEVGGEPERREQVGVEEGVEAADPPV
jgi:hypothetical protein